jgi:hypothetical protein
MEGDGVYRIVFDGKKNMIRERMIAMKFEFISWSAYCFA